MEGFKQIFITITLAGLFLFAMLSLQIQFASENNSNISLLQDKTINATYRSINSDLSSLQNNASSNYNSTSQENPTAGSDSILIFSIVNTARSFTGLVFGMFNTIKSLLVDTLGIHPVIIGVFSAILIFILILYGWRLFRQGE